MRLVEFDRSSPFPLTKRLKDLLLQQACLEKLTVSNAATVGAYLAQLREESGVREWRDLSKGLLRDFRVRDADVTRVMSAYIELAQAVAALSASEGAVSIAQAFDIEEPEAEAGAGFNAKAHSFN